MEDGILHSREAGKRVYYTLDFLRGVAAIAVVGHHFRHDLADALPGSFLAVDFFFLLSGFVLSHAYEFKLETNAISWRTFAILRIVRLYPLYILGTAIGVIFFVARGAIAQNSDIGAFQTSLLFGALMLPASGSLSADHYNMFPFNFPAWSLFWELVVNLFYALLARHLTKSLLVTILVVAATSLAGVDLYYNGIDGGVNVAMFPIALARVAFSFFAGIAVYRLYRRYGMPRGRWGAIAAPLLLLAAMALFSRKHLILYEFLVVVLVFPSILWLGTDDPSDRWTRTFKAIGMISYPLYALHGPFVRLEIALDRRVEPYQAGAVLEFGSIAGLIGLAVAVDRLYDRPSRRWLMRRFGFAARV